MKASQLFLDDGELSHKLRSINDLIDHIRTQEESTSNYSLLLGAGSSVTSGIRTAGQLIDGWMDDLYCRFEGSLDDKPDNMSAYFETNHASWFNPFNVYSSLFEKKYDLAPQRRRFVEKEVAGKLPSIGYAYLISLVDNSFFNTIFTTNFDDLINEGFYQYSNLRPIICAHDSSIHSVSITSKRPKIIKLHGDYLFDDIKSTLRETESLEVNTKEKMIEFCKEYGLIVVGYSGSDRSVMDVLEFLTKKDNYLKNGIYWCLRKDDEVSHTLRNLLWKDKVYPVLIDGFDELFAECHNSLVGKNLDFTATLKDSKLQQSVREVLIDRYNLKKNKVISTEISAISNESKRQEISSFFSELTKDIEGESKLSLTDLNNLLQVDRLIQNDDLRGAYQLCEDFLNFSKLDETRTRYLRKMIFISEKLNDGANLSRWCSELVDIDQYNLSYQFTKIRSLDGLDTKFDYLKSIAPLFPKRYELLNLTADYALQILKNNPSSIKVKLDDIFSLIDESLILEPSNVNPAWQEMLSALNYKSELTTDEKDAAEIEDTITSFIDRLRSQNSESDRFLKIETSNTIDNQNIDEHKKLIKTVELIFEKSSKQRKLRLTGHLNDLYNSYSKICPIEQVEKSLRKFFESHISDKDINQSSSLLISKAKYYIGIKNDLTAAKIYLNSALDAGDIAENISDAIWLIGLVFPELLNTIGEKLEKFKNDLTKQYFHICKSDFYTFKKDYANALQEIRKARDQGLSFTSYISSYSFILLKSERYADVLRLAKQYKNELESTKCSTFDINYNYAANILGDSSYDKVKLLNITAQKSSNDLKIASFSILSNENEAKRLIKMEFQRSKYNYYRFKQWVVIPDEYLEELYASEMKKIA